MRKVLTRMPTPLPCKYCGSGPITRSVDIHFTKDMERVTTQIEIRCSNDQCDKAHREHRHFTPKATRREAVFAWNKRNRRAP